MSRWGWVWSTLGVMGLAAGALTACSDEPGAPPGECAADGDCDDGSSCTVDLCKTGGICESVPQPGEICDDADACTVGELCDAEGVCSGGISRTSTWVSISNFCKKWIRHRNIDRGGMWSTTHANL